MPGYIKNDLSQHFCLRVISRMQHTILFKYIFTICILNNKIKARLLKAVGEMAFNMDAAFEKIKEVGESSAGVVTMKQIE